MSRAARLIERGRGKEALSFLETSPSNTWPGSLKADRLDLLGQAYQQTGDFGRGYKSFLAAHRLLNRQADPWRLAEIRLHLGDMCRQQEKFHEALGWYTSAARDARRLPNARLQLDARCGEAMALRGLEKYREALKVFERLLRTYRQRRDQEGETFTLWAMGTTERFAGRLTDAERHLRKAVRLYGKLRDFNGLAYARCGWGGTLRMMGDAARSRRLYAEAYRFFHRSGDRFGMAYSSCGQGNALRMLGRRSAARPFMRRAEILYRQLRLTGPLGFVLWSRAMLEAEDGQWTSAKKFLSEAEALFRRAKDPRGLVYVLLGKGELASAQGKPSPREYKAAAKMARHLGLPFEEAHAQVRSGRSSTSVYRRFGVSISLFSRYTSLP